MKPRTAFRLAWGTCALTLVLMCGVVALALLNAASAGSLSTSLITVASVVVGGLAASRRPENPVGWLFLGAALVSTLRDLAAGYAVYGLVTQPAALPLAQTSAGFTNCMQLVGAVMQFVLLPLYFPTGRPVSRRWGLIAWISVGTLPLTVFLQAVSSGEAVYGTGIPNPWAVEALRPVTEAVEPALLVFYIGMIFAAAASLVARYLRSRGVERQQIKWIAFAAAFIPVWFMVNRPVEEAFPSLFALTDALVIAAVPVAAGIAILRYRLYDIDRIINRALVYAILSALLVAAYLGTVVSLQFVLRSLTGENSQLAVVASTLAIAALFNPLRRLIQGVVDRRFYRQKYDATRTLGAFSATLRDETDLGRLDSELLSVVQRTLRPEHASLWLREPGDR